MSEIIESLRAELCVLHEAGVVSQAELCEFDASYDLAARDLHKEDIFLHKITSGLLDDKNAP